MGTDLNDRFKRVEDTIQPRQNQKTLQDVEQPKDISRKEQRTIGSFKLPQSKEQQDIDLLTQTENKESLPIEEPSNKENKEAIEIEQINSNIHKNESEIAETNSTRKQDQEISEITRNEKKTDKEISDTITNTSKTELEIENTNSLKKDENNISVPTDKNTKIESNIPDSDHLSKQEIDSTITEKHEIKTESNIESKDHNVKIEVQLPESRISEKKAEEDIITRNIISPKEEISTPANDPGLNKNEVDLTDSLYIDHIEKAGEYKIGEIDGPTRNTDAEIEVEIVDPELGKEENDIGPYEDHKNKTEQDLSITDPGLEKTEQDLNVTDPELGKEEVESFDEGERKEKTEQDLSVTDPGLEKEEVESFDEGKRKEKTGTEISKTEPVSKEEIETPVVDPGLEKTEYSYDEALQAIMLSFSNSLKSETTESGAIETEQYAFKTPPITNIKRTIYNDQNETVVPTVEVPRKGKRIDPNYGTTFDTYSTDVKDEENNPSEYTPEGDVVEPSEQYLDAESAVDDKSHTDNSKIYTKYDAVRNRTESIKISRTDDSLSITGASSTPRGQEESDQSDITASDGYIPGIPIGTMIPLSGIFGSEFIKENNLEYLTNITLNLAGPGIGAIQELFNKIPSPFGKTKIDSDFETHVKTLIRQELNANILRYIYSSIQSGTIYNAGFDDLKEGGLTALLSGLGGVASNVGQSISNTLSNGLSGLGLNVSLNQSEAATRGFIHGKMSKRIDMAAAHLFNTPFQSYADYLAAIQMYISELSGAIDTRIETMVQRDAENRVLQERRKNDPNFKKEQISEEELAEQRDKIRETYKKRIENFREAQEPLTRMLIQMLPPTEYQAYKKSVDKEQREEDTYFDIETDRRGEVPNKDQLNWRQYQGTQKPKNFRDFDKDTWYQAKQVDDPNTTNLTWAKNPERFNKYHIISKDYENLGIENFQQHVNDYFTYYYLIFNDGQNYTDQFESLQFSNKETEFPNEVDNPETFVPRNKIAVTQIDKNDSLMQDVYDIVRSNRTKTVYIKAQDFDPEKYENNTYVEESSHKDPHLSGIDIQIVNQPNIKEKFKQKLKADDVYKDQIYGYTKDELLSTESVIADEHLKYVSAVRQPESLKKFFTNVTKLSGDGNNVGSNNRIFSSNDTIVNYTLNQDNEIPVDPHKMIPKIVSNRIGIKDAFFSSLVQEFGIENVSSISRPQKLDGTDSDDQIWIPKPGHETYYFDRNYFLRLNNSVISNNEIQKLNNITFNSQDSNNPGLSVQHFDTIVKQYDIKSGYVATHENTIEFFSSDVEDVKGSSGQIHGISKLTEGFVSNQEIGEPLDNDIQTDNIEEANATKFTTDLSASPGDILDSVSTNRTLFDNKSIKHGKLYLRIGEGQNIISTDGNARKHIDELADQIYKDKYRNAKMENGNSVYSGQMTSTKRNGIEEKLLDLGYISVLKSPRTPPSNPDYFKIPFQFNPELSGETRNANWTATTAFGRSAEFFVWSNTGSRNIQFKTTYAILDGTHKGIDRSTGEEITNETNKIYAWANGWNQKYIMRIINRYRLLVSQMNALEGASPPLVALVFGCNEQNYTNETDFSNSKVSFSRWIVTDYSIDPREETGFTLDRVARVWDISLSLREVFNSWSDYQDIDGFLENEDHLTNPYPG